MDGIEQRDRLLGLVGGERGRGDDGRAVLAETSWRNLALAAVALAALAFASTASAQMNPAMARKSST